MRGIFIGRFQPFHIGHLRMIEEMAMDVDEIIIGIGSSQYNNAKNNPFTVEERKEMIKKSIDFIKKPYHIIPIPDINNYPKWVNHVESLTPKFDIIYCGKNKIVKRLFEEKNYKVKQSDTPIISATEIREMIANNNSNWKTFVPKGTLEVLLKLNGEDRIKKLFKKYPKYAFTVDIIAEHEEGIILIQRKNDPYKKYWAIPGGYVEITENGKQAAKRELFEETGLKINEKDLKLIGEYSNPGRDPRGPTITAVYTIKVDGDYKAGDDAAHIKAFKKLPKNLAFDHKKILEDHLKK